MSVERSLRRLEGRLHIDRQGRSVWVWALPPVIGAITGVLAAIMPGLPANEGWSDRLLLGLFGLVTMTAISGIFLISFDNDRNQRGVS